MSRLFAAPAPSCLVLPYHTLRLGGCCLVSALKSRVPFIRPHGGKATVRPHSPAGSVWGSLLLDPNLLLRVCGMNKWFNIFNAERWQAGKGCGQQLCFPLVSAQKQLSWCKVSGVGEERSPCETEGHFPYLWDMFFSRQSPQTTAKAWSGQRKQGQQGGTASLSSSTSVVQSLKLSTAVGADSELESSQ